MRKETVLVFAAIFFIAGYLTAAQLPFFTRPSILGTTTQNLETVRVYECRVERCDEILINVFNQARSFIHFAVYSLTRDEIAEALLAAQGRGVEVVGVLDSGQAKGVGSDLERLRATGLKVVADVGGGLMHTKIFTTENFYGNGSYNWTDNATLRNEEVLEIGEDPVLRERYATIIRHIFEKNGI